MSEWCEFAKGVDNLEQLIDLLLVYNELMRLLLLSADTCS